MIEFSVVIAVYNKEKFLDRTLQSVLDQTYSNFELIIINDGSTDGSETIIQSYLNDSRVKYFSQENQGAGAARNAGIKIATKPYIALLDADDLWASNYLVIQKSLIESYPEHTIYSTAQDILVNNKRYLKKYSTNLKAKEVAVLNFFDSSRQHAVIHSSSVVIKQGVLKKIGMFNTSIISGQDTDLWIRIGANYPVVFYNYPCVTYRLLPDSLFRSTTSVRQKLDPDSYAHLENTRKDIKRYLDLNRYSHAIQAKLWGEHQEFNKLIKGLNPNNLNSKQRFLLTVPKVVLMLLVKVKSLLGFIGIRLSAYS